MRGVSRFKPTCQKNPTRPKALWHKGQVGQVGQVGLMRVCACARAFALVRPLKNIFSNACMYLPLHTLLNLLVAVMARVSEE